ncbi:hypothetical protein JKP88DRAFT_287368 [Tribonema minus]|uniref:Uncharacterized protein n=1 Tax=Tribonema minus TaxID=303371 RepID=A0A835Z7J5_9STRA|nr:hypothetical protein JKP88DRAFT_287368 [Tribonema minus]
MDLSVAHAVAEELRHKHIRTLEVLDRVVKENEGLRRQLRAWSCGKQAEGATGGLLPLADDDTVFLTSGAEFANERELADARDRVGVLSVEVYNLREALRAARGELCESRDSNSTLLASYNAERARTASRRDSVCPRCLDTRQQLASLREAHEKELKAASERHAAALVTAQQSASAHKEVSEQQLEVAQSTRDDWAERVAEAEAAAAAAQRAAAAAQEREAGAHRELKKALLIADSARARAQQAEVERELAEAELLRQQQQQEQQRQQQQQQRRQQQGQRTEASPPPPTRNGRKTSLPGKREAPAQVAATAAQQTEQQRQQQQPDDQQQEQQQPRTRSGPVVVLPSVLPEWPASAPDRPAPMYRRHTVSQPVLAAHLLLPQQSLPPPSQQQEQQQQVQQRQRQPPQQSPQKQPPPCSGVSFGNSDAVFDTLRRENDRLRMQLTQQRAAQAVLLRSSTARGCTGVLLGKFGRQGQGGKGRGVHTRRLSSVM